MGFFTINRKFLPIKLHYGLFNAGTGTVQPTMPVYAKVLGFSSFVVGTIYTIIPLLGLIIKPTFGAIADKFKWHRGVLLSWEIIVCVVYLGIWFIPPAHPKQSTQLFFRDAETSKICPFPGSPPHFFAEDVNCTSSCSLVPQCWEMENHDFCSAFNTSSSSIINSTVFYKEKCGIHRNGGCDFSVHFDGGCKANCQVTCEEEENLSDTYSQWQFWLFLVLLIGAWGGTSVVTTLSDTLCIEICGDANLYGKQRLWGSLGWGVFSIINGFLIDAVSTEGEDKNYAPAFYLMLGPLIIDFFLSYRLKVTIPEQSKNIAQDVWKIMLVPKNIIFMIWCAMVGVSFGIVWNFLYWLLEDLAEAQGPSVTANIKTIEGLVAGIETAIGETPAFFFGGWIVNKIGHERSMTLIFTAIGLRYTLYSLLVNPWWCLPIEVLQNNYGLFYSTMTSYAKKIAPPGTEATIQSVLCAICEGIGVAIGSFLGGVLFDTYGGSTMMLIFGITFFVCAVSNEVIIFIFKILDRRNKIEITDTPNAYVNQVLDQTQPDKLTS